MPFIVDVVSTERLQVSHVANRAWSERSTNQPLKPDFELCHLYMGKKHRAVQWLQIKHSATFLLTQLLIVFMEKQSFYTVGA